MQNYKPGTSVSLTFSLVDESGAVLAPTSLSWRILDEAESVLQDWTTEPVPDDITVALVVPALLTLITAPATRGIRTVELEVVTDTGTISLSESIMLQGATALAFGVNSFQTYAQALLLSEDFTDDQTPGWTGAQRETREKALIAAYQRILLLPIGMHFDNSQSLMTVDAVFERSFGQSMLRDLSPVQMAALYKPMLDDLRRAQVIEAEFILNMDPVSQARADGLSSITTGESSQTFRAGRPLELPVCAKAIAELQRWVRFGARINRS